MRAKEFFEGIAKKWRERVDGIREYEIVEEEKAVERGFIPHIGKLKE